MASSSKTKEDHEQSNNKSNASIALLTERARILAAKSEAYQATSLLEEIDQDKLTSLGIQLLMADCYLKLGRESKAEKYIKKLRDALVKTPAAPLEQMTELVESLAADKAYVRGLILLPVVSEIMKMGESQDEIVEGLFRCIRLANDCSRPMISSGGREQILAIDFGMDYMCELLEDIKNNEAVDKKKRAMKQALSTSILAYNFWMLKENMKGIKLREAAVSAMDEAYGPRASEHRIYGNIWYNMGVGYVIVNKHAEAKNAYEKAMDAIEKATDFDLDFQKRAELDQCKQKMRELKIIF